MHNKTHKKKNKIKKQEWYELHEGNTVTTSANHVIMDENCLP